MFKKIYILQAHQKNSSSWMLLAGCTVSEVDTSICRDDKAFNFLSVFVTELS